MNDRAHQRFDGGRALLKRDAAIELWLHELPRFANMNLCSMLPDQPVINKSDTVTRSDSGDILGEFY